MNATMNEKAKPSVDITSVQLRRETRTRLHRYTGILAALRGDRVTVDDAITVLLDNAEQRTVQPIAASSK